MDMNVEPTGASGVDKDGVRAFFYERQVESKRQSQIEGRPIYEGKPYVKIMLPGRPKNSPDRPVQPADKDRWPEAWAKFERREEGLANGTPVEQWPRLSRKRVMELKHMGLTTVEAVAGLTDVAMRGVGPDARELQRAAKEYLQPADQAMREMREEMAQLRAENQALQARLDATKRYPQAHPDVDQGEDEDEDLDALAAKANHGSHSTKRKPGRPKKADS